MNIDKACQSELLSQWVSSGYLKIPRVESLKSQFLSAKPFSHLELKDFFVEEQAVEILQALLNEPFEDKEADLFKFKQTRELSLSEQKIIKEFRALLLSVEFNAYLSYVTGQRLSTKVVDMAGTLYEDTDFLLCHDDRLEGRAIAYLCYLSNLKEGDGGTLNLLSSKNGLPTKVEKKILPAFNSFTFFKVSPLSFHEVEEVVKPVQRLAISGWFHG